MGLLPASCNKKPIERSRMTGDTPQRNELIQQLLRKLTPEGREAWEDLESQVESQAERQVEREVSSSSAGGDREEVLDSIVRLNSLPKRDQAIVERLFDLQIRAEQTEAEESAKSRAQLDWEMAILHRAFGLVESESEDPEYPRGLEEALAVLDRHGESPHPPPEV